MIKAYEGVAPVIAASAYVDEMAAVIGKVTIGAESSIWPMAVLRGDCNTIAIGDRTSIQDGTVIHVNHDAPFNPGGDRVVVGNDVTVGHKVMLHGCAIMDRCLIGMASTIMDKVVIEPNVMVGAGSLVSPGKTLESGHLYLGSPAKRSRKLTDEELGFLDHAAEYYAQLGARYKQEALV